MYQVRPDGVILAETPDEAVALSKRLAEDALNSRTIRPATRRTSDNAKGRAVLQAIADAGKDGISSEDLTVALGLDSGKRLGSLFRSARHAMRDLPNSVLNRVRTHSGLKWCVDAKILRAKGLIA